MFRDWEILWLRASDYKNHRIFTLRCIHKDLIPVSIKLKSTLKTERAKKIERKAEKDLLQARIKAINSILDNISKQTALCRLQLASILSAQRLRECQCFIEKVGEIRFNKVKQRQLNKFKNLLNKKEGNLTRVNSSLNLISSQAGRCSPSPRGRKHSISFPGSCSPSPGEGSSLVASQTGRQAGTYLPPGEGSNLVTSQAVAHLPPGEESSLAATTQAVPPSFLMTALPPKQAVRPPQIPLLGKPLPKQAITSPQVRQVVKLKLGQAGKGPPGFPGEQHCFPGRQHCFPGKQPHT